MTISEKIMEICIDDHQAKQIVTLMSISFSAGMGQGAAIDHNTLKDENGIYVISGEQIVERFTRHLNHQLPPNVKI